MLPLIELKGEPREQGLAHGQRAGDRIRHNLSVYFERFEREGKIDRLEALRRAHSYWDVIQRCNPPYAQELRGVAQGSECDLMEIVAMNVRYEILYHQFTETALSERTAAGDCTTFAVLPQRTANDHLLVGENWDWIPETLGAVLHIDVDDGAALCFTEAGIVGGKIGLNTHGLGLAINGLNSTDDDWARLSKPFHVRCYEILRSRSLRDAMAIVLQGERPCAANYLIAQTDDHAVNMEAAPEATRVIEPGDGFLAHTNHFLDPKKLGIIEPPSEKRTHSVHRLARARTALRRDTRLGVDTLKEILRDHDGRPYSICRHIDEYEPPEERYQTVTSAIMDLHEGRLWIKEGVACRGSYQQLQLAGAG